MASKVNDKEKQIVRILYEKLCKKSGARNNYLEMLKQTGGIEIMKGYVTEM